MKRRKDMKQYNYFDCSINKQSNHAHSPTSMGPVENDIMKDLYRYSKFHGFKRVYDYKEADIVITNTIYPDEILKWCEENNIPKVKRMDGIFWQNDLLDKNIELNNSALVSDHVIFISEYSRKTLKDLYGYDEKDINGSVILNNADESIFYNKKPNTKDDFSFVTSCSNWERGGKRLEDIIKLAESIDEKINLIGRCDKTLPDNIIKHGYMDDQYEMSHVMNNSNAFISLFYRDAGSKVTCQAVNCGLPVLYVSSGGLKELVGSNGVMIEDNSTMSFADDTPELDFGKIIDGYNELKDSYVSIVNNFKYRESYQDTIKAYFDVMKLYL